MHALESGGFVKTCVQLENCRQIFSCACAPRRLCVGMFQSVFQRNLSVSCLSNNFFSLDKILRQNSELFIQGAFTSRSVSMSNAINQLDQFIYYRVVCKSMCGHAEIIISSNHSMTKWHTVFVCVKQQLDKMSCIIRNICNRKIQKKFEQKNDTTKHDWIR